MSYQDQDQAGLGEGRKNPDLMTATVWETLERDGRFGRFMDALRAAQLENNLRGDESLTVFAPTDEALSGQTDELVRASAAQHVVRGTQKAADLRTASTVKSIEGPPVTVSWDDGRARFGDASIVTADIVCRNGMLHVIDRLMRECSYAG